MQMHGVVPVQPCAALFLQGILWRKQCVFAMAVQNGNSDAKRRRDRHWLCCSLPSFSFHMVCGLLYMSYYMGRPWLYMCLIVRLISLRKRQHTRRQDSVRHGLLGMGLPAMQS